MRGMLRFALMVMVLLALSPLAMAEPVRTLSVTGSGAASAVPDEARFSVSTTAQAEKADVAMAEASDKARAVIDALHAQGIPAQDRQTGAISIHPVYARSNAPTNDAPRVVAYRASISLSIRVRALDRLGAVIGAAVAAGGNGLGGVQYGLSDPARLKDQARSQAVADAARAAGVLAAAAGEKLGAVVSLVEDASDASGPAPMMAFRAEGPRAVPVEAGEITLGVRVRAVYQLKSQ